MLLVIDGQGGGFGKALIAEVRRLNYTGDIVAVGTNTAATSAMMKSGANLGATGENAVLVNCARARLIAGPVGIIAADSMLGEISPKMANAIAQSPAEKVLIPVQKCLTIVGVEPLSLSDYMQKAAQIIIDKMA